MISYREFFACIPAGIRMMVSALIILALAWTLSSICNKLLGIDDFISNAVKRGADSGVLPHSILPAALFLLASWMTWKFVDFIKDPTRYKIVDKVERYTYLQESTMLLTVIVFLIVGKI